MKKDGALATDAVNRGADLRPPRTLYPTIYCLTLLIFLLVNAILLFVTVADDPRPALLREFGWLAVGHTLLTLFYAASPAFNGAKGRAYEGHAVLMLAYVGAAVSLLQPFIALSLMMWTDEGLFSALMGQSNLGVIGCVVHVVLGRAVWHRARIAVAPTVGLSGLPRMALPPVVQ